MKHIIFLMVLILCLLAAGTAIAGSSDNYRIDWFTPMTGSGGTASSANYTVSFTVGQSAIGTSSTGDYEVCTGFWCGITSAIKVYLPLILKNY